jgi:hypothetical protein
MFLNDQLGCCTCTSLAHAMQVWTANQGKEVQVNDSDVRTMYNAVNGGHDDGAVMMDVLDRYRKVGFAGRRLGAYCAAEFGGPDPFREIKESIALTGGVYLGVALPKSAQNQEIWDVPDNIPRRQRGDWEPGSWGGHAIYAGAYAKGGLTAITWGQEKKITWKWLKYYGSEAYALISPEWVSRKKKAPNGIDLAELLADVQIATGERLSSIERNAKYVGSTC